MHIEAYMHAKDRATTNGKILLAPAYCPSFFFVWGPIASHYIKRRATR